MAEPLDAAFIALLDHFISQLGRKGHISEAKAFRILLDKYQDAQWRLTDLEH